MSEATDYQAVLVVAFGGPEGPDDVIPFLENVLEGRNVPRERMLEVAEHYERFGGVSPLNEQNRRLVAALEEELAAHGPELTVHLGNRNWHPFLSEALEEMADEGVDRALAFFTSAYSSYSSCRQYLEDIERARAEVGPRAPRVDKLRAYYNHPGFIEANADRVLEAVQELPPERRPEAHLDFTAHSLPLEMARNCRYEEQLLESSRLVAERVGIEDWCLVYQSRSGPPSQPWLEPDVCDHLRELPERGVDDVVIAPIGFISDHMEVIYDLDTEARAACDESGLGMARAATVGTHPRFVRMIRELVVERLAVDVERPALGQHGPSHDVCPPNCCPPGG